MAAEFVQLVGEVIWYRQRIKGGTLEGAAVWVCDDTDGMLTGQVDGTEDSAVKFSSDKPGQYVVTVTIPTASGQTVKGQAKIDVVESMV
jgi:hypothetical protein